MQLVMLSDIGSTYTKATAVDISSGALLAQHTAPTTPGDVSIGLKNALSGLSDLLGNQGLSSSQIAEARKLACSSAAGGLQMVAIGLVSDLTAEAAKQAALGAGARVLRTYAYQLTDGDREEIENLKPDLILLAGGTDGGNHANIIHNAKVLTNLQINVPIIVAGNRSVAPEVASYLSPKLKTFITDNVMPQIGKLQVEPARNVIRQVFMDTIVYAKGLSRASELIDGIFMPTPAAVLRAGNLLSKGTSTSKGWGNIVFLDVGGATTDVHSLGLGQPSQPGVVVRGLPEPYAKRTVEGDLGVRVSALSLVEAIGSEQLSNYLAWSSPEVDTTIKKLSQEPEWLPTTPSEHNFDQALGYFAAQIGMSRHAGHLSEVYTPSGALWIQEGKDLTNVEAVIATGGVFIHSKEPLAMLEGVAQDPAHILELRPQAPAYYLDREYLLAAMGVLAEEYPETALQLMKDSLDCLQKKGGTT